MARKVLCLLQEDLAKTLKKRMEIVGLTTVQLAEELSMQEECRISQPTVWGILNRNIGCSDERLSNIEKIISKFEKAKKASDRILVNG